MKIIKNESGGFYGIAFDKEESEIAYNSEFFDTLMELSVIPQTDVLLDSRLWLEEYSKKKGAKRFSKRNIKSVDLLLKIRNTLEKEFPDCFLLQENQEHQSINL